jgi:hypothetical protein
MDVETNMARLDEEISRLQKAMDYLQNERQKLEASLDEYRSLAGPIRTIPPEILSEIFSHCLVDDTEIIDVAKAPLLLTFACSRWRTVAISTPRLWSSVHVKRGVVSMEMLQTWLLRSSNFPLTLAVDATYLEDYAVCLCIETLIPHCRRWQDVKLILPGPLLSMLDAVAGSVPLLQKVHIGTTESMIPSLDAFEVAPMLCDVTFAKNPPPMSLRLPWLQLKRCDMLVAGDWPYVIQRSPDLVHCRLDCKGSKSLTTVLPETPILQTHLRSLQLAVEERVDLVNIMDSITAPALDELEIEQANPSLFPREAQVHLSSFLTRSGCTIRCLRLNGVTIFEDELLACLQQLPLLADLELCITWETCLERRLHAITSAVMGQLTHRKSGHILVPKLKHLTLTAAFDFDDQTILDMVQSRWRLVELGCVDSIEESTQRVEFLESVCLNFCREVRPETIAQMALWRDEGLDLKLHVIRRQTSRRSGGSRSSNVSRVL